MRSHTILLILILCSLAVAREWDVSRRTAVLAAVAAMLAGLGSLWAFRLRRRRPAEGGFRYVYVEANGAAVPPFRVHPPKPLRSRRRLRGAPAPGTRPPPAP